MSEFFYEIEQQSEVKIEIITKYFSAWANIMANNPNVKKIGYIDLYCGPGKYSDGTPSTPLMIAKACINNKKISNKIVMYFNDSNEEYVRELEKNIFELSESEALKNKIEFHAQELTSETTKTLFNEEIIPCFSFIDPFGYQGVSFDLINNLISDWGCDCAFFFNYNRISAAIYNPKQEENMSLLFGCKALAKLRDDLAESTTQMDKENIILNTLSSLFSKRNLYVLPFRFNRQYDKKISHYIIFLSKHVLGYTIMKKIMAYAGEKSHDGIPYLEYMPATNPKYDMLYPYTLTLDHLKEELLKKYSSKSITVIDLINDHHIGTPFIDKNYKMVLLQLEQEGLVIVDTNGKTRRKGTMADWITVKFL